MTKAKKRIKVWCIVVEKHIDDDPDTSTLGKFTDSPDDWAIVRNGEHSGEYVRNVIDKQNAAEDAERSVNNKIAELIDSDKDYTEAIARLEATSRRLAKEAEEWRLPERGREYRFFKPYACGEKEGTADYQKYGIEDWKRMEGLERGDWCYVGVDAHLEYTIGPEGVVQKLSSGGLWGIESDSGDYLKTVAKEELDALRDQARDLGIRWPAKMAKEALEAFDV